MLKYKPQEYLGLLRMTRNKHLLVEGRDDKRFFSRLVGEIKSLYSDGSKLPKFDIDSAESLVDFGEELGNREKVEYIHNKLDERNSNQFIGFVDREFREFEIGERVQDLLPGHRVNGRMVWSRGHSIENYFFNLDILEELFKDHTPVDWFDEVILVFRSTIKSVLRVACALSLVGYDLQNFNFIKRSIDYQLIEINPPTVVLSLDKWGKEISSRSRYESDEIQGILDKYILWWEKLEDVDTDTLRWLCHGHIGMTFIWAAYICCVYSAFPSYEISKPDSLVSRVRGINEDIKFQSLSGCLARKVLQQRCEYPKEVVELLGFFHHNSTH